MTTPTYRSGVGKLPEKARWYVFLGFASHTVSAMTTQLCCCKSSHTHTLMNLWLGSNKTLFQKQQVGWILPVDCNLLTPAVDEWGKDRLICDLAEVGKK